MQDSKVKSLAAHRLKTIGQSGQPTAEFLRPKVHQNSNCSIKYARGFELDT